MVTCSPCLGVAVGDVPGPSPAAQDGARLRKKTEALVKKMAKETAKAKAAERKQAKAEARAAKAEARDAKARAAAKRLTFLSGRET